MPFPPLKVKAKAMLILSSFRVILLFDFKLFCNKNLTKLAFLTG